MAEAPNGDTVAVPFTARWTLNLKSASGTGTFEHRNAAGTLLATGTLTTTDLLSFKFYGHTHRPRDAFDVHRRRG